MEGRAGPAPCLGKMEELAPTLTPHRGGMGELTLSLTGKLAPSLAGFIIRVSWPYPSWGSAGKLLWVQKSWPQQCEFKKARRLTRSITTQAQIQGIKLTPTSTPSMNFWST